MWFHIWTWIGCYCDIYAIYLEITGFDGAWKDLAMLVSKNRDTAVVWKEVSLAAILIVSFNVGANSDRHNPAKVKLKR